MILKEIISDLCRQSGFEYETARHISEETFDVIRESYVLHTVIHYCELCFECYYHQITMEALVIVPHQITDYIIVGWEDCHDCKQMKEFIPEMDSITLTADIGRPIEQAVKKVFHRMQLNPEAYPVILHKSGTIVLGRNTIKKTYGVPFK